MAFAKRVEKLLSSSKPTWRATSPTGKSVRTSSSFARVIRVDNKKLYGVVPIYCRKSRKNQLLQDLHAGVRCKAKDAVAVHPGNIKALGTDGTGGAKQSNGFWHVDIPLWKGTAPKVQCRLLFWVSGPGLLIRRPPCLRFTGTHKRSNAPRWTPAAR